MSDKLGVLQLEMSVNATDKQLLANLKHAKGLGLPKLRFAEPKQETLHICGSGPSLRRTVWEIPPDAPVMALNGAGRFLHSIGRKFDYFAMLDSRPCNVNFLEGLPVGPTYLLASQVAPECFAALEGKKVGLFHLGTPTTAKVFPDEELRVGGGGTIGLTAIALASALGYRAICLYGYDSSFSGPSRHVTHQPQNDKDKTLEIWVEDRKYDTSHAMAAQVMDFYPFYKALIGEFPGFVVDLRGDGMFYDFVKTNNVERTRETELSKYSLAYEMEDYGMTEQRKNGLEKLLEDIPVRTSYLDISCGRGETLLLADKLGYEHVRGTETVPALLNERVSHATLPSTGLQDKSYDVVSLIEVIEHLLADDVEPALHELTRLARRHILISAAVQDCWIGGLNLHPSAKPEEEWDELFRKVWNGRAYRVGSLGGSPAWRVDL